MGRTEPVTSAEEAKNLVFPRQVAPCACPIEEWLAFLGHRWNALVLWHLGGGSKRHGELAHALPGISSKVLAERLAGLERRGLVSREVGQEFPRRVRYALTEAGKGLLPVLVALESWERSLFAQET